MDSSTTRATSGVLSAAGRTIRQSLRTKARNQLLPKNNVVGVKSGLLSKSLASHAQQAKSVSSKVNNTSAATTARSILTSRVGLPPKTQTLRELLASTPGFSMKPRNRSTKRKSLAAQIEQTKEGCIDLSPDSILVNTNVKALLNSETFRTLPQAYQYKLITLLPECDKLVPSDNTLRMSPTALNNEFFAKALQEWRDRLADGEFTPENQQRLKQEEEKDQNKLDPWKAKYFEPVWGQRVLTDIPKATGPSPVKPSSPLPTPKVKPLIIKKKMLVSSILRRQAVSKEMAASVERVCSPSGIGSPNNVLPSNGSQVGLLTTVAEPVSVRCSESVTPVVKTEQVVEPLIIRLDPAPDDSPSSAKRARIALTQKQAQARTLAQIKAQTEAARMQKSQPSNNVIPVCSISPVVQSIVVTTAAPQVVQYSSVGGKAVTAPVTVVSVTSPLRMQQCHTRTLAQIKAQTQAAKGHPSVTVVHPTPVRAVLQNASVRSLLTGASPSIKMPMQAQTRTLAQIKAQTRARAQRGTAVSQQETELSGSPSPSMKNHPNILLTGGQSRIQPGVKSPALTSPAKSDVSKNNNGINLQRSLAICQQELEKSLSKGSNPVSPVSQQNQPCASKLLFSQDMGTTTSPQSDQSVTLDSSRSSTPILSGIVPSASSPMLGQIVTLSSKGLPIISECPTTPTKQIIFVTANNVLNQNTVLFVSEPQPVRSVSNSVNKMTTIAAPIPTKVLTIPAVSASCTNSQGVRRITHENLRAMLAKSPPRASSAPPNNIGQANLVTIVRPASVGDNSHESQQNNPVNNHGEIVLNLNSEEINFLSNIGTATRVNPDRSPHHVIRLSAAPQSAVSGNINVQSLSLANSQNSSSSSVMSLPVTAAAGQVVSGVETRVASLLTNPVSVLPTSLGSNIQRVSGSSSVATVILQPTMGTALGSTVTSVPVVDSAPSVGQTACACSLKALVMCKKCGAFCHDDCIGPSRLCVTCLITT
ncbi:polycomb protein Asx-like [Gigantopelta aegis]|uniref:polycomb protein Asx-like n=1 Tax=Gigantopelta aegis TaxID=1735272 RepID=UPI001B88AC5E|nr:polycomb protein Asx-like [Gigantopelta aegis]